MPSLRHQNSPSQGSTHNHTVQNALEDISTFSTHSMHQSQRRQLGTCLNIYQLNIEGISQPKCEFLVRTLTEHEIDVVVLQETHAENEESLNSRGQIPGFNLVGATYDKHYGIATYVRSNLKDVSLQNTSIEDDIHTVIVKIGETNICNVYKPPSVPWPPQVLPVLPYPSVYIGDFNSHHETWKYAESDQNGEDLVLWSEVNNFHLVFDAKDHSTFHSAAWKKDYNPDLCFVSTTSNQPLPCNRKVIPKFPRTQHRPVILQTGLSIPLLSSFPRPRWNFRKADWNGYKSHLDKVLGWITPTAKNYKRFCGAVISSAKKYMPRGFRKEYVPGWNEDCEELYQLYLETDDQTIGDELLGLLNKTRRDRWTDTVENLDFRKSSREAWSLLNKLDGNKKIKHTSSSMSPNKVGSHLVNVSRSARDRNHTILVKSKFTQLKKDCKVENHFSTPFTLCEVTFALSQIKANKAPGADGIHAEFLKNSGDYAQIWLSKFFTDILNTGHVPNNLKKAKVIALLKPGKPDDRPESYRPIALLSCVYKLLERLIYNRVSERILEIIPLEQAGFRPGRNCTDQVLSLTNHIEAGFQKKLKTSVAFIDLSAAYDTVWREGLLYKFLKVIPCLKTLQLLNNMLCNRNFNVIIGEKISRTKTLNNGLAQGSVLAPLLFSLYIADLPVTKSRKFGYADDWAIATKNNDILEAEKDLSDDLTLLGKYFRQWRLKPNASKTEVSCFHLSNQSANMKLKVSFESQLLKHNHTPKYLGVTLDRTLSFRYHLEKTAAKLKTRNNILQKLCGSKWGSSCHVLKTSALGLVYSAAEYCAPVWLNSKHTKLVDVQLNNTMRIITGSIKPTPVFWLPTLSNIPPPHIRRNNALVREYDKIQSNPNLPVHQESEEIQLNRLKSRHPPLLKAKELVEDNFTVSEAWHKVWNSSAPPLYKELPCIDSPPAGFDAQRKDWVTLNRIRTNTGKCAHSLHQWGKLASPACDCGEEHQTIRHIVTECPNRRYKGDLTDFWYATESAMNYVKKLDLEL